MPFTRDVPARADGGGRASACARRLSALRPAGIADGEQPLPILGTYPVVPLPPARVRLPGKRGRDRCPRTRRALEQAQREPHDLALHVGPIRVPARVAERKVDEQEAGDAAMLDDVLGRADDDRRKPVRLQVPRNQTDGLVADRSKRGQNCRIGAVRAQTVKDLRRIPGEGLRLTVIGRGTAKVGGKTADDALPGE